MTRQANLHQVITFATDPLRGNPASVLSGVAAVPDADIAGLCGLLRPDVVAVVDDVGDETPLRFFTAAGPHGGAGHATLAAAHLVLRGPGRPERRSVTFRLANGERRIASLRGDRIAIGFSVMAAQPVDLADAMQRALGARPRETWVAPFGHVAVFDDAATVAALRPDLAQVSAFGLTGVVATAPSSAASDIVIRVFSPNAGLPEDPVCGTAHRIIVPYWADRLGRTRLHSRQLSPRGGDLWCEMAGDEVLIAGQSSLVVEGRIRLP